MEDGLLIYKVEFEGVYPVGCCLILAAFNQQQAEGMVRNIIGHTTQMKVIEMVISEPQIIEYLSGCY